MSDIWHTSGPGAGPGGLLITLVGLPEPVDTGVGLASLSGGGGGRLSEQDPDLRVAYHQAVELAECGLRVGTRSTPARSRSARYVSTIGPIRCRPCSSTSRAGVSEDTAARLTATDHGLTRSPSSARAKCAGLVAGALQHRSEPGDRLLTGRDDGVFTRSSRCSEN